MTHYPKSSPGELLSSEALRSQCGNFNLYLFLMYEPDTLVLIKCVYTSS